MALTKCKECKKEVSTKAKFCPNCGAPVKRIRWGRIIFIVVFIMCLGTCVSIFDPPSSPNYEKRESRPEKPKIQKQKIDYTDIRLCRYEGIKIKTGPGENYSDDKSGELLESEKLYVLEEKNDWIRFRVTPDDVGWSGWIKRDYTRSIKDIQAERVSKFGESPERSPYDNSVYCVKRYLKSVAKDPDALRCDEWSDVYYSKNGWVVKCVFRGKNSFGAYVRDEKWFVIQHGEVVDVKDIDVYGF
jgi:hypothetical protein